MPVDDTMQMTTERTGGPGGPPHDAVTPKRRQVVAALSYRRIGAVYVWLVIIAIFSIWIPETFPHTATVRQVLNANAVTGLVALSLIIPMAARVFDLSIAATMTICGVMACYLIVKTDIGLVPSILVAILLAFVIGLINATVVVILRVDSFIATLATGSVLQAFVVMISGDTSITGLELAGDFSRIGQADIGGLTLPVFYLLVLAAILWYVLQHTAVGRRLYAAGFNPEASRLAGVPVNRLRFGSLIVSAVIAGAAGIVLAANLTTGSPTSGTPYLLPAFATAFLGATQLQPGRFNAWGTVIAVLMLGTGVTGLSLAAAPEWAASMFTGVVLIAALAVTGAQRRRVRAGGRSRVREQVLANGGTESKP